MWSTNSLYLSVLILKKGLEKWTGIFVFSLVLALA